MKKSTSKPSMKKYADGGISPRKEARLTRRSDKLTSKLTNFISATSSINNILGIALPVKINNQFVLVVTSMSDDKLSVGSLKIDWQY